MAYEVQPPPFPPRVPPSPFVYGAQPPSKSRLPLILGVVGVLLLAGWMFTGKGGSASSGNPLMGKWVGVADNPSYCGTEEDFADDSTAEVRNGVETSYKVVYNVHPGAKIVDVYTGSPYQQWNIVSPDVINWATSNGYSMSVCTYNRK
jgi:hypothetical protein